MKLFLILALVLMPFNVNAGDGHDHGEGSFGAAAFAESFYLPPQAIKNLDIQSEEVKREAFQESISLPCLVRNPPEQNSQIHTTYIGSVKKINARIGDRVKKGQVLYTLFSMKAVRDMDVVSPIDGIVSAQNVSIGQIVQMEDTLMEITSTEFFTAEGMAYLTDDISHIEIGDRANIKIDGTHESISGYVQGFAPSVNPLTKNKSVYVDFKSDDLHVFPNVHCQMDIYFGNAEQNIVISKRALLGEFGSYFVFTQQDDHFKKENVVIGRTSGDKVEILEGLHEGDLVVTNGNYQLQYVNAAQEKAEDNKEEDNKGE